MLLSAAPPLPSMPWISKNHTGRDFVLPSAQDDIFEEVESRQVSNEQHSLIHCIERNTDARESQQDTRSADSIRPKLSAGMQTTRRSHIN